MGTPSTLRLAAGALSIGPFIASIRPLIHHGQGFFKALLGLVKVLRSFWDAPQKEWPLTGQPWAGDV